MPNNFNQMKQMAMKNFSNVSSIAPGVMPGVKWDDMLDVTCECGGNQFVACSAVKFASPLQAKANIPTLVQLPVGFQCAKCGMVNSFNKEIMEKVMPKGSNVGSMSEGGDA